MKGSDDGFRLIAQQHVQISFISIKLDQNRQILARQSSNRTKITSGDAHGIKSVDRSFNLERGEPDAGQKMSLKDNQTHDHFEDLALGYSDQLFRVAYARTGNRQDAEDIVQETYLKAYRSFDSFRTGTNMKSWLTQILINTIRDNGRRAAHSIATVELDETLGDGADEPVFAGPEEALCQDEIDPDLASALRSLSETLAVPLLLREAYDASYQEIAGILNLPIGTVMSRLSRARSALRERLLPKRPNYQSEAAR